MFGGTGFAVFAGLLYWFPKMTGRMVPKTPAIVAWFLMFAGFNVLYLPMFVLGWMGMPRRYYDYLPELQPLQAVATVGSWILAAGLVVLAATFLRALRQGEPAPANPWGARGLEWQTPSPPPTENFESEPVLGEEAP
jgi:cytochrome c oxidase subunit 1